MQPMASTRIAPVAALALAGFGMGAGAAEALLISPRAAPGVSALALEQDTRIAQRPGAEEREVASVPDAPVATPTWSTSAGFSGRSYQWSASRGALDIGMNFEASDRAGRPFDFRSETSGPMVATLPSLSIGLRQSAAGQAVPARTLLERALNSANAEAYVSKIGIQWKPAELQVNFLRDGMGIRLDGNDRMTVRLRQGVLGLYMQRKF